MGQRREPSTRESLDQPVFQSIARQIEDAIDAGRLEPGLILKEGALSGLLGASRATIRSAMSLLAGKGLLAKNEGQGFIVRGYGHEPLLAIKRPVGASDIPRDPITTVATLPAADTIKDAIEEAISVAIVFGHFKVSEQELAEFYSVSRPIVREVLSRLKDAGLVEKQLHGSWRAGPLTAKAVAEDRELRTLIEPYALMVSAPHLPQEEVSKMISTVDEAAQAEGRVSPALCWAVERDLHETALKHFPNQRAWRILQEERLPLRINALFAEHVGIYANDPGLAEHRSILCCIQNQDFAGAAASHTRHLNNEGLRTLSRLKVLSVVPAPPLPPYLQRIS